MNNPFRFCPNCRKPLKNKFLRLIDCVHCGFHFYISPASTNALIIENEKKEILLTRRKHAPKKYFWDLPGGFVDFQETIEQSLFREIKEELGLEIKDPVYLKSYWSYYPYRKIRYQTLCHAYYSKQKIKKIVVNDDVSSYCFFNKNEIPFNRLSFGDISLALRDYLKIFP